MTDHAHAKPHGVMPDTIEDGAPYIGRSMKRVEDRVLLLGAGRYTDDIPMAGLLHVAFVRSPHAHARVRGIDTARARKAPGVAAVVTGADVRDLGHMPTTRIVQGMKVPPHPILSEGLVGLRG